VLKSLDKEGFLDLLEGKVPSQPVSKKPKLEVKKEEAEDDEDDGQATWNALR
jgi:hypothetical protein